jgi:hypothetical protein
MRTPSRYLIRRVEMKISHLKELRKELDSEDLRCGSLNVKLRNLKDELDQLRDWFEECRLTGSC